MSTYNIKTLTVGGDTYRFTTDEATEYASGLLSAEDKEKLDGVAEGATANEGTVKKVTAGAGLTGGEITETGTIALDTSGAEAGSYGPIGSVTGSNGATIDVPYITVDNYGRVTNIQNKTYTAKDTTYSPATQTANGLLSSTDKVKIDDLTPITNTELSTMFDDMSAPYNPNIYDLTAITEEEIADIFSEY